VIPGRILVGTLRVQGADGGRAGKALGTLAPRPEGLDPGAVLVVRVLTDPLPGRLGNPLASPSWERAAAGALTAARRRAARPASGPVPAGAEAVLFDDWAQLLAAMASDWLAGVLAHHWWWREFDGAPSTPDPVVSTWREAPRQVPAALALLAQRGLAVRFATALPVGAAAALAAEVATAWGAPTAAAQAVAAAGSGRMQSPGSAPWARWVPEATASALSGPGRVLLGISLSLARVPALATRASFWEDAVATLAPVRPSRLLPEAPAGPVERLASSTSASLPASDNDRSRVTRSTATDVGPGPARPDSNQRRPAGRPAREGPPGPARKAAPDSTAIPTARRVARFDPTRPVQSGMSSTPVLPGPAATGIRDEPSHELFVGTGTRLDAARDGAESFRQTRVRTDLGGLFFLLNLALEHGLYGDFTRPADRGLPISPWSLLSLVGPRLLARSIPDDPVWGVLAQLDGREPGHLRVPRAMRRWAGRLSARWRSGLGRALECPASRAGSLLMELPAEVVCTSTRVDVRFQLADLPVAVRIAGLDRDPGWIPAAGSSVAFTFD
jgi:hypothetical protein